MSITQSERNKAKEIIGNLVYNQTGFSTDISSVEFTDDIGESAPYVDLVNEISGESTKKISGNLPFDPYLKFDDESLDHDFTITTVHTNVNYVASFMEQFSNFYSLSEMTGDSIESAITMAVSRTGVSSTSLLPVSEVIKEISIAADRATAELKTYKVDTRELEKIRTAAEKLYPRVKKNDSNLTIRTGAFGSPVAGKWKVNEPFHTGFISGKSRAVHHGLDIGSDSGTANPDILAIADGTIINIVTGIPECKKASAGESSWRWTTKIHKVNGVPAWRDINGTDHTGDIYGNHVEIDHGTYTVRYCHLKSVASLSKGADVSRGTLLGKMGTTGNSTGIHLHIDLKSKSTKEMVNPEPLLDGTSKGNISSISAKGNSPEAILVSMDIDRFLSDTYTKVSSISELLIDKAAQGMTEVYVNDISGKVEEIEVVYQPGTTLSIPIEGEQAPLMQNLGGKSVKVILHMKEVDPVYLSRLALMFKVSNNQETIASMLTLARSSYLSGDSRRMKHLVKWARGQQIETTLNNLIGKSDVNLANPISVDNDVLRSLGLNTFNAESFEVRSIENAAHAYNVMLTLSYVNLRNRSLESLRISKNGSTASILPLFMRKNKAETDAGSDSSMKFYRTVARISVTNCLAELLPVYILSKLYKFYTSLNQEASKNSGIIKIDAISQQILAARLFSFSDQLKSIDETFSMGRIPDPSTVATGILKITEAAGSAISTIAGIYLLNEVIGINTAKGGGIHLSKSGKIAGILSAGAGISAMTSSMITSAVGSTTSAINSSGEFLINIPSLMPHMMWALVYEYMEAMYANREDMFLDEISNNVMDLLSDKNSIELGNNLRQLRLNKKITMKWGDNSAEIDSINIGFYSPGFHRKETITNLFDTTRVSTGLYAFSEQIEKTRKNLVAVIPNFGAMDAYYGSLVSTAIELNKYAIDAIVLNLKGMSKLSDGSMFDVSDFYVSALDMLSKQSTKEHCKECLRSVIISSRLDTLACTILSSGTGNFNVYFQKEPPSTDQAITNLMTRAEADLAFITDAGNIITANGIETEIISGSIADGSFLSSEAVRKATCKLMIMGLEEAAKLASSTERTAEFSSSPASRYLPSDICLPSILSKLEPSMTKNLMDVTHYYFMTLVQANMVTVATETMKALAIALTGRYKLVLQYLATSLEVAEVTSVLVTLFSDDAIKLIIGQARMFELSKWMSGQIKAGLDKSTLLEFCEKSHVWIPSILNYGGDAINRFESSFNDYPIVYGPIVNGVQTPMCPDFYVYKIGYIDTSYAEIREMMSSMITATDELYSNLDGTKWENLMSQLSKDIDTRRNQVKIRLEDTVALNLNKYAPSEEKYPAYTTEVVKMAEYINRAFYGDSVKLPILTISLNGKTSEYQSAKSLITLDISGKYKELKVVATPNPAFVTLTRESKEYKNAMYNTAQIIETSRILAGDANIKVANIMRALVAVVCSSVVTYINAYQSVTGDSIDNISMLPDTLGNLMLVKSMVGSNMNAIGLPGMAFARSQFERLTGDVMRRSSVMQAGYNFPTVRLMFIEEDNENFYLFDDLYSYASILSVKVHMDKYSPQQVAVITVTNLYGILNNIISDQVNFESNFAKGPSENSDVNAIFLKPGCKIKVQAGFSPILTEEDTVFVGRISNVDFNMITTIEATSHGDVFLENVSNEIVKIYGSGVALYDSVISRALISIGHFLGRLAKDTYLTPSKKMRHLIRYVLNDLVQSSDRLSDFSLVPPVQTQDIELGETQTKIMDVIKKKIYMGATNEFAEILGSDESLELYVNQQLFENINIKGDYTDASLASTLTFTDEGFWISKNETAWDVLQEMNLLLPNHMINVRPFDTRSTLVWSLPDEYYRFRRAVDVDNIMCNSVINKIGGCLRDDKFKSSQLAGLISAFLNSNELEVRAGGMVIQGYWAYYSQQIYNSFMNVSREAGRRPIKAESIIPSTDFDKMIDMGFEWIFPCATKGETLKNPRKVAALEELMKTHYDILADESKEQAEKSFKNNGASIIKIPTFAPTGFKAMDYGSRNNFPIYEHTVSMGEENHYPYTVYMISLEMAADEVYRNLFSIAAPKSTSHRRLSEMHVKVSGKDIVKNDLILNEPFNCVKISYPKRDQDVSQISVIGENEEDSVELLVPLHYKLKPYSYKVYQTHFKNANAFPASRMSSVACASASMLANLMANSYSGTITMVGDPKMKEGDRIVLWDENRDMFGVLGVKTHDLLIDPETGFLSIIEPEMITRNDGKLRSTTPDTAFSSIGEALGAAMFIMACWFTAKGLSYGRKKLFVRTYMARANDQTSAMKALTGAAKSLDNIFGALRKIPILGTYGKERAVYNWFFSLKDGKLAEDLINASTNVRAMIDAFIGSTALRREIKSAVVDNIGARLKATAKLLNSSYSTKYAKNISKISEADIMTIMDSASLELSKVISTGKKVDYHDFMVTRVHDGLMKKYTGLVDDISKVDKGIIRIADAETRTQVDVLFKKLYADKISKKYVVDEDSFESVYDASHGLTSFMTEFSYTMKSGTTPSPEKALNLYIESLTDKLAEARTNLKNHVSGINPKDEEVVKAFETLVSKPDSKTVTTAADEIIDAVQKEIITRPGFINFLKRNWKKIAVFGTGAVTASWAYDSVKAFTEMYCLTEYTADRITLAPLWFRGEPLISGVDGITKKDGENAGFFGIMKSRLSLTAEGVVHAVSDPFMNAVYRVKIAALRNKKNTGMRE